MSLIQMSLYGAVFIAAIVVIRAIVSNKVPRRTFVVLWGVVFLRLLVPICVPSNFSLYTFIGNVISAHKQMQTNVGGNGYMMYGLENTFNYGLENTGNVTYMSDTMTMGTGKTWFFGISVWSIVWLVGMVIIVAYFVVSYFRCMREFGMSLPVQNEYLTRWRNEHTIKRVLLVRQSDRISSPLTYGIFRPVILMPKETDWTDGNRLRFVLEHEYVHVRHFDAAAKLIAAAVLCVHWFNPMVWVMYILFNRDIELACDEGVINAFGQASRAEYARTLIDMAAKKSGLMPFCSSFNKNSIEERITAIMKNKKMTIFSAILGFAIIAGATTIFATSAKAEEGENNSGTAVSKDADAQEVGVSSLWLCVTEDGEPKVFGPYQTNEELLAEVKPYFEEQISLGKMTNDEMHEILDEYEKE